VIIVEVSTAAEMSAAILQHAGTDCTIRWESFVVKFSARLESEQRAVQVWCRRNPNHAPAWEWDTTRWAREAPKSAKKRVAFVDDRDRAAAELAKLPRSQWPKHTYTRPTRATTRS